MLSGRTTLHNGCTKHFANRLISLHNSFAQNCTWVPRNPLILLANIARTKHPSLKGGGWRFKRSIHPSSKINRCLFF